MLTISAMRAGRAVITTTRSASQTASRMLWVTNTTVFRLCCQMRKELGSHLFARHRVKGAERLVHHQHARVVNQRPADGGALLHAA